MSFVLITESYLRFSYAFRPRRESATFLLATMVGASGQGHSERLTEALFTLLVCGGRAGVRTQTDGFDSDLVRGPGRLGTGRCAARGRCAQALNRGTGVAAESVNVPPSKGSDG